MDRGKRDLRSRARPQTNESKTSQESLNVLTKVQSEGPSTRSRSSPLQKKSEVLTEVPTRRRILKAHLKSETSETSQKSSNKNLSGSTSSNNLPTANTTNTSSVAPRKALLTSSVNSSYTSSTTNNTDMVASNMQVSSEEVHVQQLDSSTGTHTPTTFTESEGQHSRSVSRADEKSIEFSDSDDESIFESKRYRSLKKSTATTNRAVDSMAFRDRALVEFGGFYGTALLLIFLPITIIFLQWICLYGNCTFSDFSSTHFISDIMHKLPTFHVLTAYILFHLIQALHLRFCPGYRLEFNRKIWHLNALPIALLCAATLLVTEYYGYDLKRFILTNYFTFLLLSIFNAFLFQLFYYGFVNYFRNNFRQSSPNPYAESGCSLVNFALGQHIDPMLCSIDFKRYYYTCSLVVTQLITMCLFCASITMRPHQCSSAKDFSCIIRNHLTFSDYNVNALLSSGLVFVYTCAVLIFESHSITSFEFQEEGFGCLLLLRHLTTPFLLNSVALYVHHYNVTCSNNLAYISIIVTFVGIFIKHYSCAHKHLFRMTPKEQRRPYFRFLITAHGDDLLLNGLWGFVRHPNYFGDVIALIGICMPLLQQFALPPVLSILILIALLLHRTKRANARSELHYGASWWRYCTIVRSDIFWGIY